MFGASAPAAPAGGPLDFLSNPLVLIVGFFVILYMLMLRPQKKKDQQRRRMLDELKKGDRVVTIGGLHGEVMALKEKEVILRVDTEKDVHMKVARAAISRVVTDEDEASQEEENK